METRICTRCSVEHPLYKFYNGYKKDRVTRKIIPVCHHCRYQQKVKADPEYHRKRDLKKKYNMTSEQFLDLLEKQGNTCAICQATYNNYAIDHDHACCSGEITCGKCVRGVLCQKCNRGIGQFNDSIEILQNAITYLLANKDKTP